MAPEEIWCTQVMSLKSLLFGYEKSEFQNIKQPLVVELDEFLGFHTLLKKHASSIKCKEAAILQMYA